MVNQKEHLKDLNSEQLKAVEHFQGPLLVFAGAGSGKTRILTRRVASLVLDHNVNPQSILAVTFTNKACEEMRERLRSLLGPSAEQLWVATFHSACLRILRKHAQHLSYKNSFAIYDDQDSKKLLKEILKELEIDEKKTPIKLFSSCIDKAKNADLSVEEYQNQAKYPDQKEIALVYEHYQRKLMQANAMDFGDLLVNALKLFREHPQIRKLYQENIHFLLVDEFQDTNAVQYEFLKILAAQHKNIFAVGDDDQSIYGFRGADISNIKQFKKDFKETEVIKLEQNYRSTTNILETANQVIKHNKDREKKKLWTAGVEGSPVYTFVGEDEQDEAKFIATQILAKKKEGYSFNDIAVFYRTNAQSRALEEALLDYDIQYRIYGGLKFYDRREIKDVIAFLRLVISDSDPQAFLRVVNVPARGIGAVAVQKVREFAFENHCSLYAAAKELSKKTKSLKGFIDIVEGLKEKANKRTLAELIEAVCVDSGYKKQLESRADDESSSRLENLSELRAIGESMQLEAESTVSLLTAFLDRVSLSSSQELPVEERLDNQDQVNPEYVSLMTLHLAKGLEFPVVFFSGLEDGLLPHTRSMEEGNIEEERRLCYVGITRAMKELYLTRSTSRGMFSSGGSFGASGRFRDVSPFVLDMPESRLEHLGNNFFERNHWADDSFEIDDEFLEFEFQEEKTKKKKNKKPITFCSGWLKSADDL